ncbi:hypothetical protein BDY24DRAFT_380598 [Mrakia frigida]|uniref:uncharacterized protein n=1 Tax=Mrakia frigida TaxID=29902 RepID=UPI003FCC0FC7
MSTSNQSNPSLTALPPAHFAASSPPHREFHSSQPGSAAMSLYPPPKPVESLQTDEESDPLRPRGGCGFCLGVWTAICCCGCCM